MKLLALDPATRCGFATHGPNGQRSGSVLLWREARKGRPPREAVYYKAGPKKGELRRPADPGITPIDDGPKDTRLLRLTSWLRATGMGAGDLVVIEALPRGWNHGSSAQSSAVSIELRAMIKLWAMQAGVRLDILTPEDVSRHATGKGRSSPEEKLATARLRLGYHGEDQDEAVAWWIRSFALQHIVPVVEAEMGRVANAGGPRSAPQGCAGTGSHSRDPTQPEVFRNSGPAASAIAAELSAPGETTR